MAYRIFSGQRLETLVASRPELWNQSFFGDRPLIVLQNQSLMQWLKLALARAQGGYATGDFLFQDELLRRLVEGHRPEGPRLLFLDDLKFALYRRLGQVLVPGAEALWQPLMAGTGVPDPARLFELADRIAGVFHQYAMNSRLWPQALAEGRLPEGSGADPGAFAWQSRLWRDLLTGSDGTLAGLVLEDLTRRPPRPLGPPPRVVIVGSAFLSLRASAFLQAWAEAGLVEVDHLLLLPAPPGSAPAHRPWSSWGAYGQVFLGSWEAGAIVPLPAPDPGPTALSVLQASLARGLPFPGAADDGSVEVHRCPHPLRELEVLRDRLLAALAADPTLELHEIAVLAPDINEYAPFLAAAFGSDSPGRNLRHHVIDLDLGKENAWFRALDALLGLVSGTIDRPGLFTLADAPAFRQRWGLTQEDRDLWLDYTDRVSAWRQEAGSGPVPQSWAAGAERLFEGWFRLDGPSEAPGLDAPPSVFRVLGRLQGLVDALGARRAEVRRPRSLGEWARFLDSLLGEFLDEGDGTAALLTGRLHTLAADAGQPQDPLPWAGFRALVQDQVAHFPGRRGQLLTEGLHCSSLRPLRAIPFRYIAVLGLDEGRFPRTSAAPSFDLSAWEPGQEALDAAAQDRWCFWETLMAARDGLFLSWRGTSPVDGSDRPASPVLEDLLEYLALGGRPWPVRRASAKDFSILEGDRPTASPRTWRRARAVLGLDPGAPPPAPEAPAALEDLFPEVRTAQVTEAFLTPARFHLKRVRQIVLRQEDGRADDEREPWNLSFGEVQDWLQESLRRHLAGDPGAVWDPRSLVRAALAQGRALEGPFVEGTLADLEGQADRARAWVEGLRAEGWTPGLPAAARTQWAGRPWAAEEGPRLVKGTETLFYKILPGKDLDPRDLFEAGLLVLLENPTRAHLAALTREGQTRRLTWTPDPAATEALAARAEALWLGAVAEPLGFYPDFLVLVYEKLHPGPRAKGPALGWEEAVEKAWSEARKAGYRTSTRLLARDPYARVVWLDEPDPQALAAALGPWWDDLFVPLLEAWT